MLNLNVTGETKYLAYNSHRKNQNGGGSILVDAVAVASPSDSETAH